MHTARLAGIFGFFLLPIILPGCQSWGKFWQPPAFVTQNVQNGGVLQSGFLAGTFENADSIEVSLDSGSFANATVSGNTWRVALPLPASGNIWRNNSLHTASVRLTYGSQQITREIRFRKGMNRDINGDGYPDLVIGAYQYNSNLGRAYIYYSKGTQGIASGADTTAAAIITGITANGTLGRSVAVGDANGDGYADVALAGGSTLSPAFVFHSQGPSGISSGTTAIASTTITSSVAGNFGFSSAFGDMNGDGYADLVLTNSAATTNKGAAYIFKSQGVNGIANSSDTTAHVIINGTATSFLGQSADLGDVNGDGFDDLAIAAHQTTVTQALDGTVYVFYSAGSTGIAATAEGNAATVLSGSGAGNFGRNIALGDVNGDGFQDLAITAPTTTAGGTLYIFVSRGGAGIASQADTTATSQILSATPASLFGFSMDLGDVNGDGFADMVTGNNSTNFGYLFLSNGTTIPGNTSAGANAIITGSVSGANLGASAALIDLNGDGYADAIFGASTANTNAGYVSIFQSRGGSAISSQSDTNASATLTGTTASARFGIAF